MNWYLKGIENSHKNKQVSGLTDLGDFVTGDFQSIHPHMRRGNFFVIKDKKEKQHYIPAINIRKVMDKEQDKEVNTHKAKANFCGYIVEGDIEENKPGHPKDINTRIMTTKEPHTLKKMLVQIPSSHVIHEDK